MLYATINTTFAIPQITNGLIMIRFKERLGYGLGDFASSMFWKIFGMYLLFFYTKVFGISPAVAGTMFLLTRIWDSVNDPVMGIIADRTTSRWGKYRPFLLWGAIPFALIGVATFYTPDLSEGGKIAYAYITYTLMMMVYTAVNVPYASLLGAMTTDVKQRNKLSSYRMFFAYVGSFVTFMLHQPLVDWFSKIFTGEQNTTADISTNPQAWTAAAAVIGVIVALLFYLCFRWTRERVTPIAEQNMSIRQDLKDLCRNAPWWILLFAGVMALIFNSIRDGATLFYFVDFIKDDFKSPLTGWSLGTIYLLLGQAANMVGVALAAPLSNRIGKRRLYMASMSCAALFSLLFYTLDREQIVPIFVLQAIISLCAGSIFPLLWSMYADIVDYNELKSGRRATGLIFSSSSMSQKMGWALGGAVTGWLLSMYGYDSNAASQSVEAIGGIKMMMSLFPAISCVLAVVAMAFYPLNEREVRRVSAELDKKRNL